MNHSRAHRGARLKAASSVVLLVALMLLGIAPAAASPAPTHSGTLTISGTLQDGSTLTASGVTWTPAPCNGSVCSRAMTISYRWQDCNGSTCGAPATKDTQPYLPTYVAARGDVGKRIRVTETATDVRTDESEQTGSVTFESAGPVAAWPAGTAPRVDLVQGVPESSTTSTRERFMLSLPHANPANGATTVACSLDGGTFSSACGSSHSFTVPATSSNPPLAPGSHTVRVRATNAAGAGVTAFSWTVVAAPPPAGCASCFHPPHLDSAGIPMTWDWQLSNAGSSLVFRNVDLLDVDGFNNTTAVVTGIHARAGRTLPHEKAICYVSLGSWENFRSDATAWPEAPIGLTLAGFANEHWVDVRQLGALKPAIDSRLQMCATKGFDGVEVDNIDGWDGNATGFPLTKEDTQAWLTYVANQAHALNLFVIWKNDPLLASFGERYFDGALSEQCYAYKECTPAQENGNQGCNLTTNQCGVQVFANNGKWVGEVEYPPGGGQPGVCTPTQTCSGAANFHTFCNATWPLPPNGFGLAAWRADPVLVGKTFYPCWSP